MLTLQGFDGCTICNGRPKHPRYHFAYGVGGGEVAWNLGLTLVGSTTSGAYVEVDVVLGALHVALPGTEMLEIYSTTSGLQRFPVRGMVQRHDHNIEETGACASDVLRYDLSGLPDGRYLMVHRRSSAPAGFTYALAPNEFWQTFQGEPALVTTLIRKSRWDEDAGNPDAGNADAGGP